MKLWLVTDRGQGRTWFNADHSATRQNIRANDVIIEYYRWEPADEWQMVWMFVISKYGIGIIGYFKPDEKLALVEMGVNE